MEKVAVIIVSYNSSDMTIRCIDSVKKSTYSDISIIVVDNASNLENAKKLLELEDIVLLTMSSNLGYSAGINAGINEAIKLGVEYILVLNNDTIVSKELIDHMVSCVGGDVIVVPKIYYLQEPNIIWYAGGEINRNKGKTVHYGYGNIDNGQYQAERIVDFACGCCLLFSVSCYEKLGKWDESYFLYFEDADYSMRAMQKKVKILYCPKAILWHEVSASTGSSSCTNIYYSTRNRFYFLRKYHFGFLAWMYTLITRIVYLCYVIIGKTNYRFVLIAFLDFLRGKKGKVLEDK